MKKIFTLICAGIIACSISACKGATETNSTKTQSAPEEKTQSIDEKKAPTDNEVKTEDIKDE